MQDRVHCFCSFAWDMDRLEPGRLRLKVYFAPTWREKVLSMLRDLGINPRCKTNSSVSLNKPKHIAQFIMCFVDEAEWPRLYNAADTYRRAWLGARQGQKVTPEHSAGRVQAAEMVWMEWFKRPKALPK